MKEHSFKIPQVIGDGRLDWIIAILDFIQSRQGLKLSFDFHKTKTIEPAGYAILACLSDSLREQVEISSVLNVSKKLEYKFIEKLLENQKKNAFLPIKEMELESSSLLLRGVEEAIDPSFSEQIDQKFEAILDSKKRWCVRFILNELMQNAKDHSASERYFLYAGLHEGQFQFGAYDRGVSIPAKLEQKYICKDDLEYLKKSLELGVGTRRIRPGGMGLHHLFEILKLQKGKLGILSRNAQLRIYFHRRQTIGSMLKKPLRGTWCMARLFVRK